MHTNNGGGNSRTAAGSHWRGMVDSTPTASRKGLVMGKTLRNKALVIGVASSALFDLGESDTIFREQGVEAFEKYQSEHINEPFEPGVAFPFISKLLEFNTVFSNENEGVEVVVLSRNSPKTGLRVMNSIDHYHLDITRSVFRSGISPFEYMNAFNMSLFLSADEDDVKEAVAQGLPAGRVLPLTHEVQHAGESTNNDNELRVAFDFDGVLAGDSAEQTYIEAQQIDPEKAVEIYNDHEKLRVDKPIEEGPLKHLLEGINTLQDAARAYQREHPDADTPNLRVSLVTARSGPAQKRAVNTLENWGLTVDDAFFLGGLDKAPFLNQLQPHIFFDDQSKNVNNYELDIPSVHIPFGIRNEQREA